MRTFFYLRVRLMELGMTQTELARRVGISPSTMVTRLHGEQPWTSWEQDKIGAVLGIPREDYGKAFFDGPRVDKS